MPIPFYTAPPLIVIPAPQQANQPRVPRTLRFGGEQPIRFNPNFVIQPAAPNNRPVAPDRNEELYNATLNLTIPAEQDLLHIDDDIQPAVRSPPVRFSDIDFTAFSSSSPKPKKKMMFKDFGIRDQVSLIKNEFVALAKLMFEHPESIKANFIANKRLTNSQAKEIFLSVDKLNMSKCSCCRKLNINLLKSKPVDKELEPLIDIAQSIVKTKTF